MKSVRTRIAWLALFGGCVAVAEAASPLMGQAEYGACKTEIGRLHDEQIKIIVRQVHDICVANPDKYTVESCPRMREWLQESTNTNDIAWFVKGNRSCESAEYPCYGPEYVNSFEGDGRRQWAQKWSKASVEDIAAEHRALEKETGLDVGMNEAEYLVQRCLAQAWLENHPTDAETEEEEPAAMLASESGDAEKSPADADPQRQARCAEALAQQDKLFQEMARNAPTENKTASGAKALYQMGMYITGERVKLLDEFCKGEPQYATYPSTRASYESALQGCRSLASDGGVSCVPLKLW